jgi:hypothetical protein
LTITFLAKVLKMASPKTIIDTIQQTTQFLPITTAFPRVPGCDTQYWKVVTDTLAVWDPGYAMTVAGGLTCHPPEMTTWWNVDKSGLDSNVTISIAPIVCPQAYTTAATSVNEGGSTLVGCCPRWVSSWV